MRIWIQQERLAGLLCILVFLITGISYGDGGGHLDKWISERLIYDKMLDADVYFEIIDPPELSYTYKLRPAMDFGAPFNSSFLEQRIALVPTKPATNCQLPENAEELEGKVALVERGECTFFIKSMIAEKAGAKAVIISDHYPSTVEEARTSPMWTDHYYIEMIRDNSVSPTESVNIPAGFILGKNGKMIRETLHRLNKQFALINIPVNLTYVSVNEVQQPPWLSW